MTELQYFSKLTPFVTVSANNEDCVVLKVKPGSNKALVDIGCFYGDELQFRASKSCTEFGDIYVTIWRQGGVVEDHPIMRPVNGARMDTQVIRPGGMQGALDKILDTICVDYGIDLFTSPDTEYRRITSKFVTVLDKFTKLDKIRLHYSVYKGMKYDKILYPRALCYNGRQIAFLNGPLSQYRSAQCLRVYSGIFGNCLYNLDRWLLNGGDHELSAGAVYRIDPERVKDIKLPNTSPDRSGVRVGANFSICVVKDTENRCYKLTAQDISSADIVGELQIPESKLAGSTFDTYPGTEPVAVLMAGVDKIGNESF